jgi:hypothetical protein
VLVAWVAFYSRRPSGRTLFWSSLIVINLIAEAVHVGVEHPLEN